MKLEPVPQNEAEFIRVMQEHRIWARENRAAIEADWHAQIIENPITLDEHVASARTRLGEDRWKQLDQEWVG